MEVSMYRGTCGTRCCSLLLLSDVVVLPCRVAANAAENEMDAHALALSVAPCLAWLPAPHHERRRVSPKRMIGTLPTLGFLVHDTISCGPFCSTSSHALGAYAVRSAPEFPPTPLAHVLY